MDAEEYDLIVVGLGTAGAWALRTAVEHGLRTLGIERTGAMGGVTTVGVINFVGITANLAAHESAADNPLATVAYESVLGSVVKDGDRIVSLRYFTNGIPHEASAHMFIDATGRAALARLCGCQIVHGRAFDGEMAPTSGGETWVNNGAASGVPKYMNVSTVELHGDSKDFSKAVLAFRRSRHGQWSVLRQNARMVRPAAMMMSREDGTVVTEETATMADAIAGRTFRRPIFLSFEPEDLQTPYEDKAFESEEIRNWKFHCDLPMFCYASTVPYGAIVAKGVDNLLVPSKHLGIAHDLLGSVRMQGNMRKSAIAAALAAKVAIRFDCAARDVPYAILRPLLEAAGALALPRESQVNVYEGAVVDPDKNTRFRFEPYADEEIVLRLSRDISRTAEWWQGAAASGTADECSAYAYFCCWRTGLAGSDLAKASLADALAAEMDKRNRHSGNFAIALALMKDARALPILREIVRNPGGDLDPVIRRAWPNRIKAIDFLGRFQDAESIGTLVGIVEDNAASFVSGLVGAQAFGPTGNDGVCRFQTLSYALMALKSILKAHPDAAVSTRLESWRRNFRQRMLASDGYDLAARLRKVVFA